MSIIKPDRDTLLDMVAQCLDSVYLCICLAESDKINSLIPLALKDTVKLITKFYDICKYDYPEELETAYSNILELEKLAKEQTDLLPDFCIPYMNRLEETYDALLDIQAQVIDTDMNCDRDLRHEEYCDLCHLTVDLFNAVQLYKVFPAYLYPSKLSLEQICEREKRAFQMARDMKRERILPKELHCLVTDYQQEDFIDQNSFDGVGYAGIAANIVKSYLLEKLKILNTNSSEDEFDLFNFFIYFIQMEQILSFTFDDESELFKVSFAPGWERKGIEGLSLIDCITFHTQADSNDVLIDVWPDEEEKPEPKEKQGQTTVGPQTRQITFEKPEYEDKLLYISVDLPHENFIKRPEKKMGPDFDEDLTFTASISGDGVKILKDLTFVSAGQDDLDTKNPLSEEEMQQESEVPVKETHGLRDGIFVVRNSIKRKAHKEDIGDGYWSIVPTEYRITTNYGSLCIQLNDDCSNYLETALDQTINKDNVTYLAILDQDQVWALAKCEDDLSIIEENHDLLNEVDRLKKENENLKRIIAAKKRLDQAIENEQENHAEINVQVSVDDSALDQAMKKVETLDSHLNKLNEPSVKSAIEPEIKLSQVLKEDAINPQHYHHAGLECIDVMELYMTPEEIYGFCKGCAFKYLWRAGSKAGNSAEQDYKKAKWYIDKAAEYKEILYG